MSTTTYGWLVLAFPLLGTLVIGFGFRARRRCRRAQRGLDRHGGDLPRVPGGARRADLKLQGHAVDHRQLVSSLWNYASTVGIDAQMSILVDPLSVFMILIVTRRLDDDPPVLDLLHGRGPRLRRYFSYLNFFVFSMLLLVLAGNFLLLIVGWAFVGAASYLLISFWYRRTTATKAGIKAFVINVLGDAGLVLGTYFIFKHTHTLDFLKTFNAAEAGAFGHRHGQRDEPRRPGRRLHPAARGRVREVGADPAAHVAAGRDGGPDAGQLADPRRDDGHRGRVPDRAHAPAVRTGAGGAGRGRGDRRGDAA